MEAESTNGVDSMCKTHYAEIMEKGHISPLLTNIITGEQFFVKRFNCSDKMYPCYRERILTPPVNDYILWPSDMIDLTDEQQTDCSLFGGAGGVYADPNAK